VFISEQRVSKLDNQLASVRIEVVNADFDLLTFLREDVGSG